MKIRLIVLFLFIATATNSQSNENQNYTLTDFYIYNPLVEAKINKLLANLPDKEKVGQLIIPAAGKYGKSNEHIEFLAKNKLIGGVLLLNGEKEEFKTLVKHLNTICNDADGIPFTYSADAEPSLIKYKIKNSTPVKNAIDHKSRDEVKRTTGIICEDLRNIGINYNFAPVIDISTSNEAIGNRSFGDNPDSVVTWSKVFINETQKNNIIATAKHFPGHGQVIGDTHKKLVYIDGEMTEVKNYQPLIDAGVISIMVAHIAIKNNPEYNSELPSTLNRKIVTDLLKNQMGFEGIVITDAMGMGGVSSIENNGLKAIQAGVDILLMPEDEVKDIEQIINEMNQNEDFKNQVLQSVRKVIRLKICLGLI